GEEDETEATQQIVEAVPMGGTSPAQAGSDEIALHDGEKQSIAGVVERSDQPAAVSDDSIAGGGDDDAPHVHDNEEDAEGGESREEEAATARGRGRGGGRGKAVAARTRSREAGGRGSPRAPRRSARLLQKEQKPDTEDADVSV